MMKNVWLIGSGNMALEYIKVLRALRVNLVVIGRGVDSAKKCKEVLDCEVIVGGLDQFLSKTPPACTHAIVSVGAEALSSITLKLLEYGIKRILVEKPGGLSSQEILSVMQISKQQESSVFVAYNRRFFSSVLKSREIIHQDGGVLSFNFEFTEWASVIEGMQKPNRVLENWFLANSTHVVDLAFYLGGAPKEIYSYTSGALKWHPSGSVFSGAGVSESNALFSYQANWESAGRWSVEILTKNHRLILRPIEKLSIQKKGSIESKFIDCGYQLDELYKPGLYLQTQNFLNGVDKDLCSIGYQAEMIGVYNRISGHS